MVVGVVAEESMGEGEQGKRREKTGWPAKGTKLGVRGQPLEGGLGGGSSSRGSQRNDWQHGTVYSSDTPHRQKTQYSRQVYYDSVVAGRYSSRRGEPDWYWRLLPSTNDENEHYEASQEWWGWWAL